jgi:hypothetical protein
MKTNINHFNIFYRSATNFTIKGKQLQMTLLQTILVRIVVRSSPLSSFSSVSGMFMLLRTSQSHKGVFHVYPETRCECFSPKTFTVLAFQHSSQPHYFT